MATAAGLLGTPVNSGGAGSAVLYVCPDGCKASVTVSLCNNGDTATKGRAGWATGTSTNPTLAQWLLGGSIGKSIPPGDTIQTTMTVGPGQKIVAGYSAANIACTVNGIEEPL